MNPPVIEKVAQKILSENDRIAAALRAAHEPGQRAVDFHHDVLRTTCQLQGDGSRQQPLASGRGSRARDGAQPLCHVGQRSAT